MQPLTCARSVCCAPPCRHRTLRTHLGGLCVTSGPLGISVSWWVCVSSRRMRYTWSLLVKGQTELSKELQEMIMMSSPEGFFSLKPRLPSPPSQCCCKGEHAIEVHDCTLETKLGADALWLIVSPPKSKNIHLKRQKEAC